MKRTLSPQQEAERAERRAAVQRFAQAIKDMSPEARMEFANRAGLRTIESRPLSHFNSCLVMRQLPQATILGGFRQWKGKGRSVRKGEHGATIFVPIGSKNDAGDITERTGFVFGTLFDISQTEEIEQ